MNMKAATKAQLKMLTNERESIKTGRKFLIMDFLNQSELILSFLLLTA